MTNKIAPLGILKFKYICNMQATNKCIKIYLKYIRTRDLKVRDLMPSQIHTKIFQVIIDKKIL